MPAKQTTKKVVKGSAAANRKNGMNVTAPSMSQIKEEEETKKVNDNDEDLNSGFGNYLKSKEGKLNLMNAFKSR